MNFPAQSAATISRAVKVVTTREGRIEPDVLLGLQAAAEDDLEARPSHHDLEEEHDHDDFDSFLLEMPAVADPDALLALLGEATRAHDILRVKGYVEVTGKPMRLLIQGVGQRFRRDFDRAWGPAEARRSRLVVIGEKGLDRSAIEAMLGA